MENFVLTVYYKVIIIFWKYNSVNILRVGFNKSSPTMISKNLATFVVNQVSLLDQLSLIVNG